MSFLRRNNNEQGIALLMTVFAIALATILVVEFAGTAQFDQRISRRYTESVQGDYILKSGLTFAQTLLEQPKLDGIREDWLGEPWNLIASAPSLPISGFVGDPRISIFDEDGKIDINSATSRAGNPAGRNPLGGNTNTSNNQNNQTSDPSLFWKNSLRELFLKHGFQREQYDSEEFRTRGDVGLSASDTVAAIQDWADGDRDAYSTAAFEGTGFESNSNKKWFYNRPFKTLSELLLVPGVTLERMARIAPFVKVSGRPGRGTQINVNTAPYDVLVSTGLPDAQAIELVQERTNLPITGEILSTLIAGDAQLQSRLKVTSNEFSVLAKVDMPATTRWLRAFITVSGGVSRRRSAVIRYELY